MRYFAENLHNLGTVSLSIETSICDNKSAQFISSTCIQFRNISATILLPCACESVPLKLNSNTCRFRLKCHDKLGINKRADTTQSTSTFKRFESPSCLCGSPLVPEAVKWKPMPSEHWAELMDIWHCHKPSSDSILSQGMYSLVMNGIHPGPGQAFYSDTYYLVRSQDLSHHHDNCGLITKLPEYSEHKLWRWDLGERFQGVLVSIIREKIDAHAVWTFVVNEKLTLWVVQIDSQFTLTGSQKSENGLKVYFGELILSEQKNWEPLDLPSAAFDQLKRQLTESNSLLPKQLQNFGKWNMGLIY